MADVRFLGIELEGYGPFRGVVEYDLSERGLVALVGKNEDDPGASSNGAGKTTLLMAPLWVLTGETDRRPMGSGGRGLRSEVVNEESERARGKLSIDVLGDVLVIERSTGKGGQKLSVEVNGEDKTGQDLKLSQAVIERYVDTSLLSRVIFFGQLDTASLLDMTDAKRKDMIGRVVSLGLWEKASKTSKAKANALMSEMSEAKGKIEFARKSVGGARAEKAKAEEKAKAFETEKARELKKIAALAELKVGNTVYALPLDDDDINELGALVKAGEDAAGRRYESNETDLRVKVVELKSAAEKWHTQLLSVAEQAQKTKTHYANIDQGEWTCPTCHQLVRLDAAEKERLEGVRDSELSGLRDTYRNIQQRHGEAVDAYQQACDALGKIEEEAAERKEAFEQEVRATIDTAKAAGTLINIGLRYRAEESKENHWVGAAEDCEKRIQDLLSQIEQIEGSQGASQELLGSYQTLTAAFGRNGIQSFVVESALGDLGARAASYLDTMTSGYLRLEIQGTSETKKGDLREKISFKFWVRRSDGSYRQRALQQLSGGQRRRFTVAMSLAYADFAAERVGLTANMVVLDEILQHLDTVGRQTFQSSVLAQLGRESVFVISHDSEMTGLFDTVDTVKMSEDVATVIRG